MKGTGGRDKKTDDGVERDGENFSLREIRRERDRNVTLCISTQSMIASTNSLWSTRKNRKGEGEGNVGWDS